jgi:hypothetical protein
MMAALRGLAFLCVAIVLALTNSFAQEIGHVDNTAAVAYLLRDGATSEAKQGDILRLNDIVRTNDAGRIRLSLKDGSYLIAGPRSELRVPATIPTRRSRSWNCFGANCVHMRQR